MPRRLSTLEGLQQAWAALPAGARVSFEEQWAGLRGGGLACGSAIVDAQGLPARLVRLWRTSVVHETAQAEMVPA